MNISNDLSSVLLNRATSVQARATQRGASLFVAIVALVLMTIAGLSLMRSVDTGNVIAGNMAFRGSTVNGADIGVEAAAAYLNATISPAPDANLPAGCIESTLGSVGPPVVAPILGNCRYYARTQKEDDYGVPLADWSNTTNIPVTSLNGNDIQFVIERLCNPDPSVTVAVGAVAKNTPELRETCGIPPKGNSESKSAASYSRSTTYFAIEVLYRVTVRVKGPRNTIAIVQAIQAR